MADPAAAANRLIGLAGLYRELSTADRTRLMESRADGEIVACAFLGRSEHMTTQEKTEALEKKAVQQLKPASAVRPNRWERCPSTHCERRGECSSPHECSVKS